MSTDHHSVQTAALTLRFVRGAFSEREFVLEQSGSLIGRGEECAVQVDPVTDGKVSTHHARFDRSPEGWTFTDLGSTNGSLVNGRVVKPHSSIALRHGMTIELGEDRSEGTVALSILLEGGAAGAAVADLDVACPHCQSAFCVPRAMMGRMAACPHCGMSVEVPIATRLFHDGPRREPTAPRPGRAAAPPAPRLGVGTPGTPEPLGARAGEGLVGKAFRTIKNFPARREVQAELTRCEQQLDAIRPRVDLDLAQVGRSAWDAAPDAAAALPGGPLVAARQSELHSLRATLAEVESRVESAKSDLDVEMARWNSTIKCASETSAARQRDHESARAEHEEAARAVRTMLDHCLRDLLAASADAAQLRGGVIDGADLATVAIELGNSARDAADVLIAAAPALAEPQAAHAAAAARAAECAASLTAAERAVAEAEQARAADRTRLEESVRATEGEARQIRSRIDAVTASIAPGYRELGRIVVELHGAGILESMSPVLARGTTAHQEQCEIRARIADLNQRLAEL